MFVPTPVSYLYQIAVLPTHKIPDGGDILADHPIDDVQIFVHILETLAGPDLLNPVVGVVDDAEKTSQELRDGLNKISLLVRSYPNARNAFEKILGDLYLAARQEGAKAAAAKLVRIVDSMRV